MRIRISFSSANPVLLNPGYNHALQACIYGLLNDDLRDRLHNGGFLHGKRRFKLFTFSLLQGHYSKLNGAMEFDGIVSLHVSSPVSEFIQQIVSRLTEDNAVRIGQNELKAEEIAFLQDPNFGDSTVVRALSPITVYSTLYDAEGRKKTYYYSPYEPGFSELVKKNLIKKAELMELKNSGEFKIEPISVRETAVNFKGVIVRGWLGKYRVSGDKNLLYAGYEAGLGSRNSAGFGMVEVV